MAGAQEQSGAAVKYRLLRELGQRSPRTYAALREDGTNALFVVQHFGRDARVEEERVSPEALTALVREARCLVRNWHPNIGHVRHVDRIDGAVYIATDFVEGITLEDLLVLVSTTRTGRVEPAILARIFLDVLSGLQALHGLRDGVNTPLNAVHGELCPANVVIGRDGVARLVSVFRPRPAKITPGSEALGYAAPETLAGEIDQDARSDLWSVGVMLWESLTGQRLYLGADPARIAQRQREEEVAFPTGALAEIAMKAIAFDPLLRFRSASDMAASVRALARARGTEVASGAALAQVVLDLAGDRIRMRRAELHPGASGQRRAIRVEPPMIRKTTSGSMPRVSVATSTAPLPAPIPSTPESAPPSAGEPRGALMSFEKSAPILESARAPESWRSPDRRPPESRRGRKPTLTPPPGRIRRISSLHHIGAPAPPPLPPAPASSEATRPSQEPISQGSAATSHATAPTSENALLDDATGWDLPVEVETTFPPMPSPAPTSENAHAFLVADAEETRRALPGADTSRDVEAIALAQAVAVAPPPPPPPGAVGSTLLAPVPPLAPSSAPLVANEHPLTTSLALLPRAPPAPAPLSGQPLEAHPQGERRDLRDPREEVTVKRQRVGLARRAAPLILAGMAVLAIATLLAGAAIIARQRTAAMKSTTTTTTVETPSTVVIAPATPAVPTSPAETPKTNAGSNDVHEGVVAPPSTE